MKKDMDDIDYVLAKYKIKKANVSELPVLSIVRSNVRSRIISS